jgi:hypothetical protein
MELKELKFVRNGVGLWITGNGPAGVMTSGLRKWLKNSRPGREYGILKKILT